MFADDNFAVLCPGVDLDVWCLSPTGDICCGICPHDSISGLGDHIALAFSSLSSIAAIALSPSSSQSALISNLIHADAYALSLLGYLLSNSSGLDWFHAAYALLLALACLTPLTAVPVSPPYAVTGQKSPAEQEKQLQATVSSVLSQMENGGSFSDDASDDENTSLRQRRRRRKREARVRAVLEENPDLVEEVNGGGGGKLCGLPVSHLYLYFAFSGSIVLWGATLYLGVLGGIDGSTRVSLSQSNCTSGLGNSAVYLLYADIAFFMLAFIVFIGTIISHCMNDVAKVLEREVLAEYTGNTKLVFGASFVVWILWFASSSIIYFMAASNNLLEAGEFSFGFGTTFSCLMLVVPVYSLASALWSQR